MAESLTPKQKSAIERAKRNPDLRPILFRKATGLQWFSAFKDAGFVIPTEIPQPVPAKEEGYASIPVWPITDYLAATSDQLRDPNNETYAAEFLDFIRAATNHAKDHGFGNYRVWWQLAKTIRNIPPNLITAKDLELVDYWLDDKYERGVVAETIGEHWLVDLLDNNDDHCKSLSIGLLQILYKVQFVENRYGGLDGKNAILRFDSWHAEKLTKGVASKAGQVLGKDAVDVFRARLENILVLLNNDQWSSMWRSAIEDHEQNHTSDDAEYIIVEGFRDSLLAYAKSAPDSSQIYVGKLLDSEFITNKRIAIHVIDKCYKLLYQLVAQVIVKQHFESNFRHELWHLLHNHYPEFSGTQKRQVQEVIESLVEVDGDGHRIEGATAYGQVIWLSAIKDYGSDVSQNYKVSIDIVGGAPEHPDFSSYTSSGWVGRKSPIPKEELLSMKVEQLVERLSSYEDLGQFGEPGLDGLAKALRQAVKSEPVRFCKQLHAFSSLDLAYVYELLEAYGELWTEKAKLPWDEIWGYLLAFCQRLVEQERFWVIENTQSRGSFVENRDWVVGGIGRLIENGTRSDEHVFPEKYLEQAGSILQVLLEKEKGEEFRPDSDAVSIAINSPRGRCIEAFINLSLRLCRLADKSSSNHLDTWGKLEPVYNAELVRADSGEYEFATLVVNYLPNFLYMSKDWVLANLNSIFDQDNYQKWLCAMNGYAYVGTVYEGIYRHLKNGHFIRALDDENLKERVAKKIIQNIAIAYINNFESLDDGSSLIRQLLVRNKYSELSQLIWFLWTLRKDKDQKIRQKIYDLWLRLLDVIDTSTREGKKLASKLCNWTVFVEEINDENKKLILAVASFADENYNSHELLKSIARFSKRQPEEAYEIWQRLLEGACPDFPEEAIRTALANLVQAGPEGLRNAKEIVSAYLKVGNERPSSWLHEITTSLQNA